MLIENNYSIITKKYPLRLRTARKGLIQLFIQKDFTQQCEDTFFFNDKELLNIVYTNVWFALEGFIDVIGISIKSIASKFLELMMCSSNFFLNKCSFKQ